MKPWTLLSVALLATLPLASLAPVASAASECTSLTDAACPGLYCLSSSPSHTERWHCNMAYVADPRPYLETCVGNVCVP